MNCPRCGEPVEPGAAFCGNCGQALQASPPAENTTKPDAASGPAPDAGSGSGPGPAPDPASGPVPAPGKPAIPSYAIADARQSRGELKLMVALIIAVLAVPGAIVPVLGATLAITGIVLATTAASQAGQKKLLRNAAIGFAGLAIVLSVGMYVLRLNDLQKQAAGDQDTATSGASDSAAPKAGASDTPCYKVDLPQLPTMQNVNGDCNLQAGNAGTLAASSEIFTVDAARQADATEAGLLSVAPEVIETTIKSGLPDYTITAQRQGTFAGSPAYIADAKDSHGSALQMAMVFRPVQHGENIFVLVHGVDKGDANVGVAEKSWVWK